MKKSVYSHLRPIRMMLLAFVPVATGLARAQTPSHFSHLTFTVPPGWASSQIGGWTMLAPQTLPPGQTASIGISPGGVTSRPLADEFSLLIKASQGSYTTVKAQPVTSGTDGQGLPTLTQTVVLQDAAGAKLVRMYVGKKNGNRFEALDFTASPEAVDATFPAFKALYGGLAYDDVAPTAQPNDVNPKPGAAATRPGGAGEGGLQPGAPAQPIGAPQGAGVKLSTHDKGIYAVAMAVGHDGTIHVAFVEALLPGVEDAVYYRSSSDGGRSWSEAKNLSEVMPGYEVGYVQIAVDASNRVYVVWRVAGEPNLQTEGISHTMNTSSNVVYRVRTGGAWNGSALNVNPPCDHNTQDRGAGSFFAGSDPSGRVHVAYVLSTDVFHPELMFGKQHQFKMGNGSVAQVDLDGAGHSAPREIFLAKVTDDGTYKACDGLDLLEGYFDTSGSAHFTAFATHSGEGDGANRIVLIEKGVQKPGITLPGPGYSMWSPPPTLLLDAQGRKHIVAFFAAGENHGVRDYLLGSDVEPKVIRSATNAFNSMIGFQACQGPNGQMIALMEMNDSGKKGAAEIYISTSSGNGWTKPVAVSHNAGSGKSTYAVTGSRSSTSTVTTWMPGIAAATFDKQGHLVLLHERDEMTNFGSSAFGATVLAGDTAVPRLYFMRF